MYANYRYLDLLAILLIYFLLLDATKLLLLVCFTYIMAFFILKISFASRLNASP